MTNDYTNCDWFHELSNMKEPDPDPQILNNSNFLTDNQTKRFLERYFDTFYVLDSGSQPGNDLCVLRHSNGLCVIGLAPGNHIFKGCYPNGYDEQNIQHVPHRILGLDFQISNNINRLRNHVQGRRKHGGHVLQSPLDVIAYAVCDQDFKHPIYCAIPGRLLEVNSTMAISDQLTNTIHQVPTCPTQNRVLTPIGGPCTGSIVSYAWILIPNLGMKHSQTRRLKNQPKLTDSYLSKSDDLIDENELELPTCVQQSDFGRKLTENFKLNVVKWDEYCKLRNL